MHRHWDASFCVSADHPRDRTAAINNAKCCQGTTALSVTGPKLIMESTTSLSMATFTSRDGWRSFSSTNSRCQEFQSLLQQETRNEPSPTVGSVIWYRGRNSRIEHYLTATAIREQVPPLQLLWNIQPLQPHESLSTKAVPYFCWNSRSDEYQTGLIIC